MDLVEKTIIGKAHILTSSILAQCPNEKIYLYCVLQYTVTTVLLVLCFKFKDLGVDIEYSVSISMKCKKY